MIERIYNTIITAFYPLTDTQIIVVIIGLGAVFKVFNKMIRKIYKYITKGV